MDEWFGRGEASITVPPMDGAFRPNDLLDSATTVLEIPEPDCLAETSRGLVVSSGRSLFSVDRPDGAPLASFDAEISAVAGLPDGGAAVGLIDGRIVFVGGQNDGKTIPSSADIQMHHRARPCPRRGAARRQWLGLEWTGGLEARPDGEERLRARYGGSSLASGGAPTTRGQTWPIPTAFSRRPTRWSFRRAGAAR